MKFSILTCVLLISLAFSQSQYTKIVHNIDPQAKCLDGSPAALYLHEGGDTKNLLIYFVGGGSCAGNSLINTLDSCYSRSKTEFGSSRLWPAKAEVGGLLSTDPTKSRFANWTKMIFIYCDGAFHQGHNKDPVSYKGSNLYFRGADITRAHLKFADGKYDFSQSERIVVSGSSAGGMATYIWTDRIKAMLAKPEVLISIPESGIFLFPGLGNNLRSTITDNSISNLMLLSNTHEATPLLKCNEKYPDELWRCFYIQQALPLLNTKMFFVESSYDEYVIKYFLNVSCLTAGKSAYSLKNCNPAEMATIEAYRQTQVDFISQKIVPLGHSVWSISCSWHASIYTNVVYFSEDEKVPMIFGANMKKAVESYVFEGKRINAVDSVSWPNNTPCAY